MCTRHPSRLPFGCSVDSVVAKRRYDPKDANARSRDHAITCVLTKTKDCGTDSTAQRRWPWRTRFWSFFLPLSFVLSFSFSACLCVKSRFYLPLSGTVSGFCEEHHIAHIWINSPWVNLSFVIPLCFKYPSVKAGEQYFVRKEQPIPI